MVDTGTREMLGLLLQTQAEAVANVVRGKGSTDPMPAIAATSSLAKLVDEVLRLLVLQARTDRRTWREIGDLLGTTRQAAFQRFGSEEEEEIHVTTEAMTGAAAEARRLLQLFLDGRHAELRESFAPAMSTGLSEEMLKTVRQQLEGAAGAFDSFNGRARVQTMGVNTVVDVPMRFAWGDMKGRVAFDPDERIAGFFVLRPDVP